MLNDLWNNLIMMSCWQADLSQEWSCVMDTSAALVSEEDSESEGLRIEKYKQDTTDSEALLSKSFTSVSNDK